MIIYSRSGEATCRMLYEISEDIGILIIFNYGEENAKYV